jgi:hypothetical protein
MKDDEKQLDAEVEETELEGEDLAAALEELGIPVDAIEDVIQEILDLGYTEEEAIDALDNDDIIEILANYGGDEPGDEPELDSDEWAEDDGSDKIALLDSLKSALNDGIISPDELKDLLGITKDGAEESTESKVKEPKSAKKSGGGNNLAELISSFKV